MVATMPFVISSPSTSLRTGSVEEWSGLGNRDIDGQAVRPSERERTSQSLIIRFFLASRIINSRTNSDNNKRCFFAVPLHPAPSLRERKTRQRLVRGRISASLD